MTAQLIANLPTLL